MGSFEVVIADEVEVEMLELSDWLHRTFGSKKVQELADAFEAFIEIIAQRPLQFPQVADCPGYHKAVLLSKTMVYYRIDGSTVYVTSFRDGRREGFRR